MYTHPAKEGNDDEHPPPSDNAYAANGAIFKALGYTKRTAAAFSPLDPGHGAALTDSASTGDQRTRRQLSGHAGAQTAVAAGSKALP